MRGATLLCLLLCACALQNVEGLSIPRPLSAESPLAQEIRSNMDFTTNPCDNFYQFACGSWINNTVLSQDENIVTKSFTMIEKKNTETLKALFGGNHQLDPKLATYFKSCMDLDAINSKTPASQLSSVYKDIQDLEKLVYGSRIFQNKLFAIIGRLHAMGSDVLFGFGVSIDSEVPTQYLPQLSQAGLQLPDKSYYTEKYLVKYAEHIKTMFDLVGLDDSERRANLVIELESQLAQISMDNAALRDPFATYNKYTIAKILRTYPRVALPSYFPAANISKYNIKKITDLNVATPQFFSDLNTLLGNHTFTSSHFANYLRFATLHSVASLMTQSIREENFNFFGKFLSGTEEQSPRQDSCIESTDETLGMLLSQYYVNLTFPATSKTAVRAMVDKITDQMSVTLSQAEWMDDVTRKRALVKLSKFEDMIGYPDVWPTYTGLDIDADYFQNKVRSRQFQWVKQMRKIGAPVDRLEWEMTPETVNAYYEPTMNDIVFPAAILQAPFFDAAQPTSFNYGGIGVVMSHEGYHGFDDQGRLYNGDGKLENWWTQDVSKQFDQRAQCLSRQYSQFQPLPGVFVNGNLTLGENIADNAGTKNSFLAYKKAAGAEADQESILKGYTNNQLFYISYGQLWCSKARDEAIKQRVLTDPHSPGQFRVNGVLQNQPEFAQHFNCPAGSYMNPTNKCIIF